MLEVPGAEALWLLEGSRQGRVVYLARTTPVLRPAVHILEFGRLIMRTPVPAAAVTRTLTYHVDGADAHPGTGWMVTATGPAETINDPHEAAHYRRTLTGWHYGPHDTLLRIRPQTITGFRLAVAETEAQ
jgi:hypothetical protein